jgi:hypothetical protein
MHGDDRVRFCGDCKLNVYNLSWMTRLEATELIEQNEGRHCVRFFRRKDGTFVTRDCPVRWTWTGSVARMASLFLALSLFVGGTLVVIHWKHFKYILEEWVPPVPELRPTMGKPIRMQPPPLGSGPPPDTGNTTGDPGGTPPSHGPPGVR